MGFVQGRVISTTFCGKVFFGYTYRDWGVAARQRCGGAVVNTEQGSRPSLAPKRYERDHRQVKPAAMGSFFRLLRPVLRGDGFMSLVFVVFSGVAS